ncbi:MAG: prolyl oligopeptidase family serine peptidase [Oscillospiraceae bacterium]|jgi:predicted esterase|nr:prolyl oligopeptidase family serine peptidase [Oscillospiraceae bacterium]
MKKLICFSGVEAPDGVRHVAASGEAPEHRVYSAIMDGDLCEVRVKKGLDLLRSPGWAVWPGPFLCEVDEAGYIVELSVDDSLITGYSISAPRDGKIVLGVEETEYSFVPGAPVYTVANPEIIRNYKSRIEDLQTDWNDNYFIRQNDDGAITEMYIFRQAGDGVSPLLDDIKKFRVAWGPVEPDTGLAIEYNYYAPPARDGVKYPLFIWFHGLHGGTSAWTNLFEYNPIGAWAGERFQRLFSSGGAYIMTPRANEDLRPGHGISWNPLQVKPFFAALDDFLERHPDADRDRIYVGGYSMGGGMTWLVIRERPEVFAAAVPCCPRMDYIGDYDELSRVAALPIWEIHGENDFIATPEETERLRAALLDAASKTGADTRLLTLPTGYFFPDGVTRTPVDHLVWIPALNNLLYDDGAPYSDKDGAPVPSTLIVWLNAQRAGQYRAAP